MAAGGPGWPAHLPRTSQVSEEQTQGAPRAYPRSVESHFPDHVASRPAGSLREARSVAKLIQERILHGIVVRINALKSEPYGAFLSGSPQSVLRKPLLLVPVGEHLLIRLLSWQGSRTSPTNSSEYTADMLGPMSEMDSSSFSLNIYLEPHETAPQRRCLSPKPPCLREPRVSDSCHVWAKGHPAARGQSLLAHPPPRTWTAGCSASQARCTSGLYKNRGAQRVLKG